MITKTQRKEILVGKVLTKWKKESLLKIQKMSKMIKEGEKVLVKMPMFLLISKFWNKKFF